ncbi:hypothetical protein RCL1_005941 [Eukaryota sp. TZLM3-RCL]
MSIKWKADHERSVIVSSFEKRGWIKASVDEDWNVYWASVHTIRHLFSPDVRFRPSEEQLLNHFPNHLELTRKDLMVKNIKRYRKELEREGNPIAEKNSQGEYLHLELIPPTYSLPAELPLFLDHYRRNPNILWILKPSARAQGSGVFIVNKMSQLQKFTKRWANVSNVSAKDSYVASRYIHNPLLVGGRKFDLRLYVLVTSYRPLQAYLHRHGFARFCTQPYSLDMSTLDNHFMHLTNIAIQKTGAEYNADNGCKWHVSHLRVYLEQTYGIEAAGKCFEEMEFVIEQSLRACQNVIINDKHCFECYGYDIIIDDNLRPWLIEVNASPSLSVTTDSDRAMKVQVISDVMNIVAPNSVVNAKVKSSVTPEDVDLGGFSVLVNDQAKEMKDRSDRMERKKRLEKPRVFKI